MAGHHTRHGKIERQLDKSHDTHRDELEGRHWTSHATIAGVACPLFQSGPTAAKPRPAIGKSFRIGWLLVLETETWFADGRNNGIAIIGGAVSRTGTILDFEIAAAYEHWLERVFGIGSHLLDVVPIARTPSGGYHVYLRCRESVPGNAKLGDCKKAGSRQLERADRNPRRRRLCGCPWLAGFMSRDRQNV